MQMIMSCKQNILFTVSVGTLFTVFIFIINRDQLRLNPNVKMRAAPSGYHTNSDTTGHDYGHRLRSSLIHRNGNLSLQSQLLYRVPVNVPETTTGTVERPAITLVTVQSPIRKKLLSKPRSRGKVAGKQRRPGDPTYYSIRNYMNVTRPLKNSLVPLSKQYSRVFQWNDRDPDGWKNVPLSPVKSSNKMERIIFNRVGKCGSRSVINMLRDLAQRNNFNLISSLVYNQTHISEHWEEHIVSVLDQVQTPYLFQRHLHYVDFKRHNASKVVYINIVREPIARLVSSYYFSRFGDGTAKYVWKRAIEELNETIDDCVRNEHRDCTGHRAFYIIPFFCGNLKQCTVTSKWALDRAIDNVKKKFLVVGILEEFDLTLRVLEKKLPGFFAGATELYQTAGIKSNIPRMQTRQKVPPSNETIAILREKMQYEYTFYNFIKDRLYKQKKELRL